MGGQKGCVHLMQLAGPKIEKWPSSSFVIGMLGFGTYKATSANVHRLSFSLPSLGNRSYDELFSMFDRGFEHL